MTWPTGEQSWGHQWQLRSELAELREQNRQLQERSMLWALAYSLQRTCLGQGNPLHGRTWLASKNSNPPWHKRVLHTTTAQASSSGHWKTTRRIQSSWLGSGDCKNCRHCVLGWKVFKTLVICKGSVFWNPTLEITNCLGSCQKGTDMMHRFKLALNFCAAFVCFLKAVPDSGWWTLLSAASFYGYWRWCHHFAAPWVCPVPSEKKCDIFFGVIVDFWKMRCLRLRKAEERSEVQVEDWICAGWDSGLLLVWQSAMTHVLMLMVKQIEKYEWCWFVLWCFSDTFGFKLSCFEPMFSQILWLEISLGQYCSMPTHLQFSNRTTFWMSYRNFAHVWWNCVLSDTEIHLSSKVALISFNCKGPLQHRGKQYMGWISTRSFSWSCWYCAVGL